MEKENLYNKNLENYYLKVDFIIIYNSIRFNCNYEFKYKITPEKAEYELLKGYLCNLRFRVDCILKIAPAMFGLLNDSTLKCEDFELKDFKFSYIESVKENNIIKYVCINDIMLFDEDSDKLTTYIAKGDILEYSPYSNKFYKLGFEFEGKKKECPEISDETVAICLVRICQ